MVRAQLSAEIIIEKIKTSRCNFNTEPSVLAELKRSGVPDAILMAMIKAPYGPPLSAPTAQPSPVSNKAERLKRQPFDPHERIRTFRNSKRFSIEYDKFKDRTYLDVGPFYVGGTARYVMSGSSLYMTGRFMHKGEILSEAISDFVLWFRASGKEWEFLKERHLYALVESERLDLGEGLHDGDVRYGGVSESLGFLIPAEIFQKLGVAQSVQLRIGRSELTLKDEHKEAFRDLYSLSIVE